MSHRGAPLWVHSNRWWGAGLHWTWSFKCRICGYHSSGKVRWKKALADAYRHLEMSHPKSRHVA